MPHSTALANLCPPIPELSQSPVACDIPSIMIRGELKKVPLEIIILILEFLPIKDLRNVRLTSSYFKLATSETGFFHHVSLESAVVGRTFGYHLCYSSRTALLDSARLLDSFPEEYNRAFDELIPYRRRDWLQHVTVDLAGLFPLTAALAKHNLLELPKLTVISETANFDPSLLDGITGCNAITDGNHMLSNVKDTTIRFKPGSYSHLSDSTEILFDFLDTYIPRVEKLTMLAERGKYRDRGIFLELGGTKSLGRRHWQNLRILHISNLRFEVSPFKTFIRGQPRLESALLEKVRLQRVGRGYSGWRVFFEEFKGDTALLSNEPGEDGMNSTNPRPKIKFFVSQLETHGTSENCEEWGYPNVMELSSYVPT